MPRDGVDVRTAIFRDILEIEDIGPYIFNLENVAKYCGPDINTIPRHNLVLDQSYERLNELLFPYMGGPHG